MNLLETCRKKCVAGIEEAITTGKVTRKPRTRKRKARKEYLLHQKLGRKSRKQHRKMQRKHLRHVKRNLKQLNECLEELQSSSTPLTSREQKTVARLEDIRTRTAAIVAQQEQVAADKKVKDRIVSFHNQSVRPIVRGKYPIAVEFGRKQLVVEKDGFLYLAGSWYDNISDAHLVEPALAYCDKVLGETPLGVGADRGFDGPEGREVCRRRGVERIGIQRKGKPRKKDKEEQKQAWYERLRRRRCGIEGYISVAKRWYGLDRAEYRIDDGEEMWACLGLLVMNLKKAVSPRPPGRRRTG